MDTSSKNRFMFDVKTPCDLKGMETLILNSALESGHTIILSDVENQLQDFKERLSEPDPILTNDVRSLSARKSDKKIRKSSSEVKNRNKQQFVRQQNKQKKTISPFLLKLTSNI